MSDVSLIWFSMEEGEQVASRERVRELAEQLGFVTGNILGRDSKMGAFAKACKTRLTYTDEAGQEQELRANESKRTTEHITMQITKQGLKVAEWKFVQARDGGKPSVRWVTRRGLNDTDAAAVLQWRTQASAAYDKLRVEAPWVSVRQLTRAELLRCAVPVIGRESMYFIYDDEIEVAHKIRRFLLECGNRSDVTILAIDDMADYSIFAASADVLITAQLEAMNERIAQALTSGRLIALARKDAWVQSLTRLRTQTDRHERRLIASLPQARSSLLVAERLVSEIPNRPGSFK